jgi:hypothetical protein
VYEIILKLCPWPLEMVHFGYFGLLPHYPRQRRRLRGDLGVTFRPFSSALIYCQNLSTTILLEHLEPSFTVVAKVKLTSNSARQRHDNKE